MPRIFVLKHVPYEGPAAIADWAAKAGHELSLHEWYQTPEAPAEFPDYLIVMGGPMNVDDEQDYPWLAAEKAYLRKAIDAGTPVLGICLGAQLIAAALGKKVYPGKYQEFGWLPLSLTSEAAEHPLLSAFPNPLMVFHWHGDTFDLPDGATLLGSTTDCVNQGFAVGKCIGLQFHIEIDQSLLRGLIADHLLPDWQGPYISAPNQIISDASLYHSECKETLFRLLDRWATQQSS